MAQVVVKTTPPIEFPDKFLPVKIHDLYYSMPGEGKSEAEKAIAKQALKENPGKIIKLVIGDGSAGTWAPLIRAKKARLIEVMGRPWPTTVIKRLTSGWDLQNPDDPTSPLIPPTPELLNQYCFTSFEGASVFCKYMMGNIKGGMAWQAAKGNNMGPDAAVTYTDNERDKQGKVIDGSEDVYGTNGTAHYMAVQGHIVEFMQQSRALPGHVIWSAHEVTMDDAINIGDLKNPTKIRKGQVICGPEAGGKALAPNLQRIMNDTLHFQTIAKQVKDAEQDGEKFIDNDVQFRLWTRDHFTQQGATNVKNKACTRNVPEDFPAYFDGAKKGENILKFYLKKFEIEQQEIAELG